MFCRLEMHFQCCGDSDEIALYVHILSWKWSTRCLCLSPTLEVQIGSGSQRGLLSFRTKASFKSQVILWCRLRGEGPSQWFLASWEDHWNSAKVLVLLCLNPNSIKVSISYIYLDSCVRKISYLRAHLPFPSGGIWPLLLPNKARFSHLHPHVIKERRTLNPSLILPDPEEASLPFRCYDYYYPTLHPSSLLSNTPLFEVSTVSPLF